MNAGWTMVSRGDAVDLRVSPGRFEGRARLVSVARDEGVSVAIIGRLDYREARREEIAGRVPSTVAARAATDDAALVLALYRRFGASALARLEGDFSVVVVDGPAARVVASRDPMGGFPLYWARHAAGLVLATAMDPLLEMLPPRDLDRKYLAEFLMLPGQVQEVNGERTVHEGVHRVPAGHAIEIRMTDGSVAVRRYWDWADRIEDPGSDDLLAVADGYGERLRAAVAERMRGRVAAHLSGGMDSTATALLADACVGRGLGEGPLHTITLVHESTPGLTGEGPYIEAALSRLRHAVAHKVPADDLLDFDAFADAPPHDEPYPGLRRLGLDRSTIDAAASCGADTLLTGLGADEMTVMLPLHLVDLVRRGRIIGAWAEARRWARVDNCSPVSLIKPYVLDNLLPPWAVGGVRAAFRAGPTAWDRQNEWTIPPWIRRDFARAQDLRGRSIEAARALRDPRRPLALSLGLHMIACRQGDVDRWALGLPRGLAISHPFLDARVLRYGLGMLLRLRPRPEGQKPVLAHAMRDVLPPEIIARRLKGRYDKVAYLGLSRNLPLLEALVRSTPLEDLGLIRPDILTDCLQRAALGLACGVDGLHKLNLTMALIKWLAMRGRGVASIAASSPVA
ncbi:asparagine synthase-related protein [Aquisphaera insulae]|uniref:asparagine synthase-related protein n=1 Tax=Aquisphaera insulae TaxID=2712864 RepID=UPI0013EC9685|nr:asparagine synthase-related protein [Aquisphaera insulae]